MLPSGLTLRDARSDDAARPLSVPLSHSPPPAAAPADSPACPSLATDEFACRDNTLGTTSNAGATPEAIDSPPDVNSVVSSVRDTQFRPFAWAQTFDCIQSEYQSLPNVHRLLDEVNLRGRRYGLHQQVWGRIDILDRHGIPQRADEFGTLGGFF